MKRFSLLLFVADAHLCGGNLLKVRILGLDQ